MSDPLPIRVVLARCAREARLGHTTFGWASLGQSGQEEVCREADRLIRMLEAQGIRLARVGDPQPAAPLPSSPTIYSDKIAGRNAERQLRKAQDVWEVLKVEGCETAVQLTFTLALAYELAGRALQGDREVATAPGILTTLAAALEIHRCNAVTL